MKAPSQRALLITSLALPALSLSLIFLFPVTAWKAWGGIHEALGNNELAHEANVRAIQIAAEQYFHEVHGEEGVWVYAPEHLSDVLVDRYLELVKSGRYAGVVLKDGSTGFYVFKHMEDEFSVENLEEYKARK